VDGAAAVVMPAPRRNLVALVRKARKRPRRRRDGEQKTPSSPQRRPQRQRPLALRVAPMRPRDRAPPAVLHRSRLQTNQSRKTQPLPPRRSTPSLRRHTQPAQPRLRLRSHRPTRHKRNSGRPPLHRRPACPRSSRWRPTPPALHPHRRAAPLDLTSPHPNVVATRTPNLRQIQEKKDRGAIADAGTANVRGERRASGPRNRTIT